MSVNKRFSRRFAILFTLAAALALFLLFVGSAHAQTSAIIKGEVSTGSYANVKVTSGGLLKSASALTNPTSVAIISATTAASGTGYTAYASTSCNQLDIVNNSGTAIEYRRGATGSTIPIPTGTSRLVVGITNASSIDIRRVDTSTTQVAIAAECIVN